jgi:hypothetical protein
MYDWMTTKPRIDPSDSFEACMVFEMRICEYAKAHDVTCEVALVQLVEETIAPSETLCDYFYNLGISEDDSFGYCVAQMSYHGVMIDRL